ncbi:putative phage tail protein [Virgibacillus sp. Bac330]|uniref:putative phage tail protein n=1 Tax=Virgibacillus sp. Bac330 TaxID=2419841 RepID=UPI000EF4F76B|nr:putative phage tail protein [Virgibacillus sp. Bac330]
MNRLLSRLPDLLHGIREFKALTETEKLEFNQLAESIDKTLDDQFIETATLKAIERREKMLNIIADPSTESLENRRIRILNRYQTKPPFTKRYLQQQLDTLLGVGRSDVTVNPEEFILTVTTSIDNAFLFREMEYTINTVKPANIIYQQETSIIEPLLLKETGKKQVLTRNTRLGTKWNLGNTPWADRENEVVIFD